MLLVGASVPRRDKIPRPEPGRADRTLSAELAALLSCVPRWRQASWHSA
jgi:hypothetical protein